KLQENSGRTDSGRWRFCLDCFVFLLNYYICSVVPNTISTIYTIFKAFCEFFQPQAKIQKNNTLWCTFVFYNAICGVLYRPVLHCGGVLSLCPSLVFVHLLVGFGTYLRESLGLNLFIALNNTTDRKSHRSNAIW